MYPDGFSIGLAFRHFKSARYAVAVNLARGFESYCEEQEGETLVHSIYLTDELKRHDMFTRFISLIKIVGGWKETALTVSGQVVPLATIERLIHVGECYQRQRRSGNPYHYCNGFDPRHAPTHFGCRLLTEVNRFVPRNGEVPQSERAWYRVGELDDMVFSVNKGKILAVLMDEAQKKFVLACPVFNRGAVAEEVNSLPDEINVRTDGKWLIETRSDGTTGIRMRTLANRVRREDEGARSCASDSGTTDAGRNGARSDGARLEGVGLPARGDSAPVSEDVRVIPDVRFSDVGGQDKAVSEVRDWVELPLLHPELFRHVGVPMQVGVILYGPPGTGKTLLAQAVAGECQAHLEMVNGPEILSKWVGQSEENLRKIFERARRMAPSVVLLDEIDAIAPARDRSLHGHEITLVSQLLTLMDGLYDRGQVVVIATTNRLDAVDPALRRPGRFDYSILMEMPDAKGRQAIFERHLKRMAVAGSVDTQWLAELTPGMSGADIAKACRQAGMTCVKEAIRRGYHSVENVMIEPRHLMAALEHLGCLHGTSVARVGS